MELDGSYSAGVRSASKRPMRTPESGDQFKKKKPRNSFSGSKRSKMEENIELQTEPDAGSESLGPNQELLTFLTRVDESLSKKKDTELYQELSDLFSTMEGDEIKVIEDERTNQILRRVIVKCEIDHLSHFVNIFTVSEENLQFLLNGIESCAFLEKCCTLLMDKMFTGNKKLSDLADLKNSLFKIVDFIVGTSGNETLRDLKMIHLVKKLIFLLTENLEGNKNNASYKKVVTGGDVGGKKIPEDQKEALTKLVPWIGNCDVNGMLSSASCNSLLVSLFHALGSAKCFKLVSHLFNKLFPTQPTEGDDESFKNFCMDKQTSVVIEAVIANSNKALFRTIFELVSPFIAEISSHSTGNYVVQRLLTSCREETVASELFTFLKEHLLGIMESGYFKLFNCLLELCRKFPSLQSEMYSKILELFQCTNGEGNIIVLLSYYTTSKEYNIDPLNVAFKPSAALSVQHLFNWTGKPLELFLKQFSKCDDQFFIQACCDKNMSYTIEAFFQSETISDEMKQGILTQKVLPNLKAIAMDKCGSFLVQSLVKNSGDDAKHKIMEALLLHKNDLPKSHSGFILTKVFYLSLYERNKDQWAVRMR